MKYLLDTHAIIWFITEDKQLPLSLKTEIENTENLCYISIASFWEIGIKHSLGKLDLKASLDKIFELIEASGFTTLPILPRHILASSTLPFHHRDPFDRLIISQAINEELVLISRDQAFQKYELVLKWT